MSYESNCDDYDLCGDLISDDLEYEENAFYDGWIDPDPCPDCGTQGACECWRDELDLEDQLDCLLCDRCPICGDIDPYACECGCNDPDAVPF